ncbi:MAG: hypothetical protein R2829_12945 [Bacteroidia bacterium]
MPISIRHWLIRSDPIFMSRFPLQITDIRISCSDFQVNYALTAKDTGNSNLGNDIFKSYETKTFEYGNRMGQGYQSRMLYSELRASYLIN